MKIRKGIIFLTTYFNEIEYKRFGVVELEKNGFEVEFWCLIKLIYPHVPPSDQSVNQEITKKCVFINTRQEYIKAVSEMNNDVLVISTVPYDISNYFIYRALSTYHVKYSFILCGPALPAVAEKKCYKNFKAYCQDKLRAPLFSRLAALFYRKLPCTWIGIDPAYIVLVAGNKGYSDQLPINKSTLICPSHSRDYDLFLLENKKEWVNDDSLCVFLDTNVPYHHDTLFTGEERNIDPASYYSRLRDFFSYLEEKYNYHIVIAAHPTSDYVRHADCFGDREVIKWQTCALVRKSMLVLTHESTSISFAILYNKPMIFLTMNSFKGYATFSNIEKCATALKAALINMDDYSRELDIKSLMYVNSEIYNRYIDDYIKCPRSSDMSLWDNFSAQLKEQEV